MLDFILFVSFPYLSVAVAVFFGLYRYYSDRFSYSSVSSQFLENRALFWGSVPWHYGILVILGAHFLALLFPGLWGDLIGNQARLYVLEATGIALALGTILGLGVLIVRRFTNPRILAVTSVMDWVLLAVLLSQVVLGFWVALFFRWGSDWYLHTAVPWLISLAVFNPDVDSVTVLPWTVKLHMLGGFLLVLIFPFTRLVHAVTFPITYLWRPYQVVIWNQYRRRDLR